MKQSPFGANGQQNGISFQIGASMSNGQANGSEITYDNTQITATNNLTIKSGNDTNLIGTQLAGNTGTADIGATSISSRYKIKTTTTATTKRGV